MGKKLIIDILTCKLITITNQDLDGLDIFFYLRGCTSLSDPYI